MEVEVRNVTHNECDLNNSEIINNNKAEVPGHLAIQMDHCQLEAQDYTLYGVDENGMTEGTGVTASKTVTNENDDFFLLFSITELMEQEQLKDNTKELVVKTHGHELGRDKVNNISALYLG